MNKNVNPLVSILIPTYNSARFVSDAIESALSQTYKTVEIVIVDNASTDETMAILSEYASNNSNIYVYQNETNLGPVNNWRRCTELAKGDFAVLLFSDDVLAPDFVSLTLPYLLDPAVGFVYSAVAPIDQDGNEKSKEIAYKLSQSGRFPMSEFVSGHLLLGADLYPLSPGCALFRTDDMKSNLRQAIPDEFDVGFISHGAGPDLMMYLMCALRYPLFAHVNEKKAYFRWHENNLSKLGKVNLAYALAKAWFGALYYLEKKEAGIEHFRAAHLWRLMRLRRLSWYRRSLLWDCSPWRIAYQGCVIYLLRRLFSNG